MAENSGAEIVFGIAAPIGVQLDAVYAALRKSLELVDYKSEEMHLIELIQEVVPFERKKIKEDDCHAKMTAGNECRKNVGKKDAVARLAVTGIRRKRAEISDTDDRTPIERMAYVLRSLKTPEEVNLLRDVYRSNFYLIGCYMAVDLRRAALAQKLADGQGDPDPKRHFAPADKLILRDEDERDKYGQNVRKTFPLADLFVDCSHHNRMHDEIQRFVELIFGHPYRTPRPDEVGMYMASGAKLRSADSGRQVGSCITNKHGDVVAIGSNEVPKAFGGEYWEGDEHDGRDFNSINSRAKMRGILLRDLLARLREREWLSTDKNGLEIQELQEQAESELLGPIDSCKSTDYSEMPTLREKAVMESLIEFMRPVHGEMSALMSCVRNGMSTSGCTMYVTTFPCHECARLIVSSGIRRVVFIEPYPKSMLSQMYKDSIMLDGPGDDTHIACEAFIGVAPRRYTELFDYQDPRGDDRKREVHRLSEDGSWVDWESIRRHRSPRTFEVPNAIMVLEDDVIQDVQNVIQERQKADQDVKKEVEGGNEE